MKKLSKRQVIIITILTILISLTSIYIVNAFRYRIEYTGIEQIDSLNKKYALKYSNAERKRVLKEGGTILASHIQLYSKNKHSKGDTYYLITLDDDNNTLGRLFVDDRFDDEFLYDKTNLPDGDEYAKIWNSFGYGSPDKWESNMYVVDFDYFLPYQMQEDGEIIFNKEIDDYLSEK